MYYTTQLFCVNVSVNDFNFFLNTSLHKSLLSISFIVSSRTFVVFSHIFLVFRLNYYFRRAKHNEEYGEDKKWIIRSQVLWKQ